jgi:hypothetical protein
VLILRLLWQINSTLQINPILPPLPSQEIHKAYCAKTGKLMLKSIMPLDRETQRGSAGE